MQEMQQTEWEKINELIYEINNTKDIVVVRRIFLKELNKLVSFDLADFCLSDSKGTKAVSLIDPVVVSRYSKKFEDLFTLRYEKHFEQLDYTKWVFSNPESIVYRESDIIDNEARKKSSYYLHYLLPMNLINVAGMSLAENGTCLGAVNLYRTEKSGDFTDREIYLLKQFMPHLKSKLIQHKEEENYGNQYEKGTSILKYEYDLSNREIEIVKLVCSGDNNKEISDKLCISINTVKKHMGNILYKFQLENRVQLINFLIRNDKELFD